MIKIQKTKVIGFVSAMSAIFPVVAAAQVAQTVPDFIDQVKLTLTAQVFPFLFVVGTLIFIVAVIRYLYSADADKEKLRQTILWSIIGLAAIISLWALVGFFTNYIGVSTVPTRYGQHIQVQ